MKLGKTIAVVLGVAAGAAITAAVSMKSGRNGQSLISRSIKSLKGGNADKGQKETYDNSEVFYT